MRRTILLVYCLFVSMPLAVAQFPDVAYEPPADWTHPVFKLSQSYPPSLPPETPFPGRPLISACSRKNTCGQCSTTALKATRGSGLLSKTTKYDSGFTFLGYIWDLTPESLFTG